MGGGKRGEGGEKKKEIGTSSATEEEEEEKRSDRRGRGEEKKRTNRNFQRLYNNFFSCGGSEKRERREKERRCTRKEIGWGEGGRGKKKIGQRWLRKSLSTSTSLKEDGGEKREREAKGERERREKEEGSAIFSAEGEGKRKASKNLETTAGEVEKRDYAGHQLSIFLSNLSLREKKRREGREEISVGDARDQGEKGGLLSPPLFFAVDEGGKKRERGKEEFPQRERKEGERASDFFLFPLY